ncbi:MAG: hypothetical protein V1793_25025 [Pseudomonadota bacterium]
MIKNLDLRLNEAGKIKIGVKGKATTSINGTGFRLPQKLDHFILTTTERDANGDFILDMALMDALKQNPLHVNKNGDLIRIPIRFLYDDPELNFPTRYVSYISGQMDCYGDGEKSFKRKFDYSPEKATPCPCPRIQPGYDGKKDRCKATGTLTCIVDEETVGFFGTAHKFRTTSINTVAGMLGGIYRMLTVTKGRLAGIPLYLYLTPKTTTTPDGHNTTVYIVSVCYRGTMQDLRGEVIRMLTEEKQYLIGMDEIEKTAKSNMKMGIEPGSDEEKEFVEEFFPDAVVVDVNRPVTMKPEPVADDVVENEVMDKVVETTETAKPAESTESELAVQKQTEEADQDGPVTTVQCPTGPYAELYARMLQEKDLAAACALANRLKKPDLIYFMQTEYPTWGFNRDGKKPKILDTVADVLAARLGIVVKHGGGGGGENMTGDQQQSDTTVDTDEHPFIRELLAITDHITVANACSTYFKPIPIDRTKSIPDLIEMARSKIAKEDPMWCAVCHERQYMCLSGTTCKNGHSGAGSLFVHPDPSQPGQTVDVKPEPEQKPEQKVDSKPEPKPEPVKEESKPAAEQYPRTWDDSGPIVRDQLIRLVEIKADLEKRGKLQPDKWPLLVAYFLDKDSKPLKTAKGMTTKQGETFITMLVKNLDAIPF